MTKVTFIKNKTTQIFPETGGAISHQIAEGFITVGAERFPFRVNETGTFDHQRLVSEEEAWNHCPEARKALGTMKVNS